MTPTILTSFEQRELNSLPVTRSKLRLALYYLRVDAFAAFYEHLFRVFLTLPPSNKDRKEWSLIWGALPKRIRYRIEHSR
jgi:hypothetical protein